MTCFVWGTNFVPSHFPNNVLGLSTTTGEEVHASVHKLSPSMLSELGSHRDSDYMNARVCGGGMTAAGIALCFSAVWSTSSPTTLFLPILAV